MLRESLPEVEHMSDTPKTLLPTWIRGSIIAAGFLMAIAVGETLFHSQAVYAQLESWKLIPMPQRFTELYFENNTSLPTTVTTKPLVFDFGIHNQEGEFVAYSYEIVMETPSGLTQELSSGTIALPDGQVASIPVVVSLPKGIKTAEIFVELPNQKQVIDFRVGATS
jgi:hypothetical protein